MNDFEKKKQTNKTKQKTPYLDTRARMLMAADPKF